MIYDIHLHVFKEAKPFLTGYNAVAFKLRGTHLSTIKGENVRHLRNTSDKTILKISKLIWEREVIKNKKLNVFGNK